MKLGKLFAALAGLALTLGFAGQAPAADAAPIKIGVYLPLTGQNAFGGQLELEGVRLAHKEMPTVLGRPVDLVVVDNKSDKVEAANAVKRLVERDKVVALLVPTGPRWPWPERKSPKKPRFPAWAPPAPILS